MRQITEKTANGASYDDDVSSIEKYASNYSSSTKKGVRKQSVVAGASELSTFQAIKITTTANMTWFCYL